ncbi:MAG: bifunctional nicotinamidase/pyrazinamidase [SAR324 cluster bacterium]|nr:bifunctional nicotinamidase/pyrazinamidase [SAR324 cluster bacterium]
MKALLLVDLQNDFTPDGALPVPEGDQIVPLINKLQKKFDLLVATQDWHPADHESFAVHHNKQAGEIVMLYGVEQILWPVHCVQNSYGAAFIDGLNTEKFAWICQKGMNKKVDSYSGFFENDHQQATGMDAFLKERGVSEIYITGLATDYCVKFTALDARSLGYPTYLIADATRGVNLSEGDAEKAIGEMSSAGVTVVQSSEIFSN